MTKNQVSGPILAFIDSDLGPRKFFYRFYFKQMLDIIEGYHCAKFQAKVMNQTWENGQKASFGHNFDLFWPKFGPPKYFCRFYLC